MGHTLLGLRSFSIYILLKLTTEEFSLFVEKTVPQLLKYSPTMLCVKEVRNILIIDNCIAFYLTPQIRYGLCFAIYQLADPLMPSGPRDDQHRAPSWRVFSQTGHHGHVNYPPAQYTHPCPSPSNFHWAGCTTQCSGNILKCISAVRKNSSFGLWNCSTLGDYIWINE